MAEEAKLADMPLGPLYPFDPDFARRHHLAHSSEWFLDRAGALVERGPERFRDVALEQRLRALRDLIGDPGWGAVEHHLRDVVVRFGEQRFDLLREHVNRMRSIPRDGQREHEAGEVWGSTMRRLGELRLAESVALEEVVARLPGLNPRADLQHRTVSAFQTGDLVVRDDD